MTKVETPEELKAAVAANPTSHEERAYLIKRAIELDCVDEIPESWGVDVKGDDNA